MLNKYKTFLEWTHINFKSTSILNPKWFSDLSNANNINYL